MKYFALLTEIGESLLANATALGTKLELTQMAVGDGDGKLPTPDPKQTKLVAEKRRGAINTLFVDEKNKNQIVVEQIIPEIDGGWWIREIGLFDKSDNLIAVANCPETYKPQLSEGSGRTQTVRIILIVSNTESVELKIDPSVVLATREYVDKAIEVQDKKINDIVNKKLDKTDVVQETGSAIDKIMSQNACTENFAMKISSDSFEAGKIYISGSSTDSVLSIGGSSGYDIIANKTAKKLTFRNVSSNIIIDIPNKSGTLALTTDITPAGIPIGATVLWDSTSPYPDNFLEKNGQPFSKTENPQLAQIYPTGVLPDQRGYAIRGWDHGRGIDTGRNLATTQDDAIRNITASTNYSGDQALLTPGAVPTGAFKKGKSYPKNLANDPGTTYTLDFDASLVVPTANENRMKNYSVIFLVRAK